MEIPQIVRTYVEMRTAADLDGWLATFAPDGTYSDPNLPKPTLTHSAQSQAALCRIFRRLPGCDL